MKHTRLLILGCCTGLILLLLGCLTLPRLLEWAINSNQDKVRPIVIESVRIHRIGLSSLEAGLELRDQGKLKVNLPRIQLQFSIAALLKGEVESLLIDGGTVHWQSSESPAEETGKNSRQLTGTPVDRLISPLLVREITLRDLSLTLHQESRQESLQLNGLLSLTGQQLDQQGYLLSRATAVLTSHGALNGKIRLDLQPQTDTLGLTVDGSLDQAEQLRHFPGLPVIPDWRGQLTIQGTAELDFARLSLLHLQGRITAHNFVLEQQGVLLANTDSSQPLELSVSGTPQAMEYQLHNLRLSHPMLNLDLDIQGKTTMTQEGLALNGNSRLITSSPKQASLALTQPLSWNASYQLRLPSGKPPEGSARLESTVPGRIILSRPDQLLSAEKITLTLDSIPQEKGNALHISLFSQGLQLNQNTPLIFLPELTLKAQLLPGPQPHMLLTELSLPRLHLPQTSLIFQNVKARLPIQWPFAPQANPTPPSTGSLTIQSIEYQKQQAGTLKATLTQDHSFLRFQGTLTSPLLPACALNFSGQASQKTQEGSWQLQTCGLTSATLFPLLPLPTDLDLSGQLRAEGQFHLTPTLSASLKAEFSQGQLRRKNQLLEDIHLTLSLPDLPSLRSAPAQPLTFSRLTIGEIQFGQGAISWQLEDASTLFVERARLNWCDGHLDSGGFRLNLHKPLVDTTLYADRLTISTLLSQLGIPGTTGQGSLNGRLPVHFSTEGLRLDNGFLFSTPGNGGILNFKNQRLLRDNLPSSEQGNSLDYVLAAVEHFSYDWARLTFQSEGEDLLLTMSINGKPADPLPYAYRQG